MMRGSDDGDDGDGDDDGSEGEEKGVGGLLDIVKGYCGGRRRDWASMRKSVEGSCCSIGWLR